MIIIKKIIDLNNFELIKCNSLITQCFSFNRINTYELALLYKVKNNIVGFLGISHDNYLNQLCVDFNYRNRGYATKLLSTACDILVDTVYLFVDKNKYNTELLVNFYKKNGFEIEYENDVEYKMFK
jgi:ribosomal protein S18 acetylase RimI-like enzyme